MPGGPEWCELFLILYRTPFSLGLFRIFTFERIILNPVTVAKHLVVLTVPKYSCVRKKNGSSQQTIAAGAILKW